MKEDEKMTNEQLKKFIESIIIIAETTQDVNRVIEYLKRIQKQE
jgi:hypothetical protein